MDNSKQFNLEIPKKPWNKPAKILGILVIAVFFGGFGLWAALAPLESAAIAPGKIVVIGNKRTVQHLEGGIIEKIYVRDGSKVKKNQVLIELDNTRAKIAYQLRRSEVNELLGQIARLKAERDDLPQIEFPARLANSGDKTVQRIIRTQMNIFKANQEAINSQIEILKQRITQLEQQIKGTQAQLASHSEQLALIEKEVKEVKILEKKRLVERSRLLALQREQAKLRGLRGENTASIATLQQKIGETKLQMITLKRQRQKEIVDELREAQQKYADALEKEKAAEDVYKRTLIRAPQAGTVVNLQVFTQGGVIKAGEDLMDIVPSQEELIAEARVSPLDIDVVHQGLIAKVRLTALKQRSTPTLLGKVINVSADSFEDEKTAEQYYKVRVKINPDELKKFSTATLYPGMPVQVMIITAKRTFLQYLFTPIKESFNKAMREQ